MGKRKSYDVRNEILRLVVKEGPVTYTKIQTKLGTNYDSVKNNIKELEEHGLINIKKKESHPENGRPYFEVEITQNGRELVKKKSK